uniref:Methylated-DNA-[protein]-cysteine S-methyltransferase DNA binding domain-containing protein n=1 Tax=Bionectria ochroleuca TaxID=29856 RepID=A0A8H7K5I8_BIOOC
MSDPELVAAFRHAVYTAVQEIPHGRVTNYAQIAFLIGEPQRPRQVGACLKGLPAADSDARFHSANVPWHRVINAKGLISHRGPGSAARQAAALRAEDVEVTEDAMGEFMIDFGEYGWFPEVLPSEQEQEDVEEPPPPPRRRDQEQSRRRRKERSRRRRTEET